MIGMGLYLRAAIMLALIASLVGLYACGRHRGVLSMKSQVEAATLRATNAESGLLAAKALADQEKLNAVKARAEADVLRALGPREVVRIREIPIGPGCPAAMDFLRGEARRGRLHP